jgi:hypothetical protein
MRQRWERTQDFLDVVFDYEVNTKDVFYAGRRCIRILQKRVNGERMVLAYYRLIGGEVAIRPLGVEMTHKNYQILTAF